MRIHTPPVFTGGGKQLVMDIECFPNYFLVKFMRVSDGLIAGYELTDGKTFPVKTVRGILDRNEIITFNGEKYDIPMLRLAMAGANNAVLKAASDDLILNGLTPWGFERRHKLLPFTVNHIDLIELTLGVLSLKVYGGRIHCPRMQDLPYDGDTVLTPEQMKEVSVYCDNDLMLTRLLLFNLRPQIELRRSMGKQYRMDLRSRSDAQIAEEVIKAEITKIKGRRIQKPKIEPREFVYQAPSYIEFTHPDLIRALQIVTTQPFKVTEAGRIDMPAELLTLKVHLGSSVYQMGMGGLHSTESTMFQVGDLYDWDVASYYPSIILNCGLYPPQLGPEFLEVYRNIVTERLEAKRSGNKVKADALKITINGSFGKLGSPYSVLYSPELMVQVTVTGQLSLLMLIEMLESNEIPVISGNTDGIVAKCPPARVDLMRDLVKVWEEISGFEMEMSKYAGLFSRDVNNYIAIKEDGAVKLKGVFASPGLNKNPQNEICSIALVEYLKHGTPFEETIRGCRDITKFVTVRTVKGGAEKDRVYLGRAVRWYYAKGVTGAISYRINGNQVAMTSGAKPIMDLSGPFPEDIDYAYYINECHRMF